MKNYAIPTEKIIERLRFENPWWSNRGIEPAFENMKRRLYFHHFFPLVEDVKLRRAIILMGPRRVGKTVMMHHAVQELINRLVSPFSIAFVGVDNPLYVNMGLEELMHLAVKASGGESADKHYIFFDEIQYLTDWERHLKVLVDSYPKTKFVVSGSAAAALRLKSDESGAGRFHDFMLPPLTFQEFLHLQDLNHLVLMSAAGQHGATPTEYQAADIKALNEQFFNYLNYGGYPEVIFNSSVRGNLQGFIKHDIIDKVLLRDLPGLYGIRNVQELNRFFTYLAYNTGKEFSPQKISKDSGLKTEEVRRYMEYLESAFLIHVVYKIDENARYFRRVTGFKVYLTNPTLRTALFSPVTPTDDEAGHLVETAIYAQWMHRGNTRLHYAKWKLGRGEGEVDMVRLNDGSLKPMWALEIKWSNRYLEKPSELKSLLAFCETNGLNEAVVTTIDKSTQLMHAGILLNYQPAALYAYNIGANTLT